MKGNIQKRGNPEYVHRKFIILRPTGKNKVRPRLSGAGPRAIASLTIFMLDYLDSTDIENGYLALKNI
jgi:hypothetical protein